MLADGGWICEDGFGGCDVSERIEFGLALFCFGYGIGRCMYIHIFLLSMWLLAIVASVNDLSGIRYSYLCAYAKVTSKQRHL